MKNRTLWRRTSSSAVIAACLLLTHIVEGTAQNRGGGGARPGPGSRFETVQEAAPVDLTGSWVSVVTEDWRVRMVTPPRGYYESVPLNPEGRRVADSWDPEEDEANSQACKAYGAAAIMRVPGRLRIRWEGTDSLRMDLDAGTQTRLFHFSPTTEGERSWQGLSVAEWEYADTAPGEPLKGNLKAVTTNLRAGYLRKNGVPYSEDALVDRILRPAHVADRRGVARCADGGYRSAVPGRTVHYEYPVQAAS